MAATGWRGTSSVTMALAVRATCRLYSWFVGVRRGELFGVGVAVLMSQSNWQLLSVARVDIPIQPTRVIFLFLLLSLFSGVVVGRCCIFVPTWAYLLFNINLFKKKKLARIMHVKTSTIDRARSPSKDGMVCGSSGAVPSK